MTPAPGTPFADALERVGVKVDAEGNAAAQPPPTEVRTELVPYPHPALSLPAHPVTDEMWDKGIVQELVDSLVLVREQLAAMKVDSYAVSAPQIAVPFRAFVWDNNGAAMALINPEIVEQSLEQVAGEEQCLSFLGKYHSVTNRFESGLSVQVSRSQRVVVRGWTAKHEYVEVEAVDIVARMMQHEIDHLDGVTMVDRLATRQLRRTALRQWFKMHPELQEAKKK